MNTYPDWLRTIHHDGSEKYVSILRPQLGDCVVVRLRVGAGAPARRVILRTAPDGEQVFTLMERGKSSLSTQWWQVELPITQPTTQYRFILECDDGIWWHTAVGAAHYDPLDATDFQILANYESPDWLETAVFYQIFPDRFANGNPATNPRPDEFELQGELQGGLQNHRPQTYPWGTPPPPEQAFPLVFYGGDLPGLESKLDYLQALGVNAIYLNPIFTAHSNHKYDVADFYHVDPHFGGDEALASLRRALDKREMRYILDIVPNHCGYSHSWFQSARQSLEAPEAGFFTFNAHPDEYESWLGVWTLPKLNYNDKELRRRIYKNEDAVFRHWLKPPYAADGWRVDVANMLGRQGEIQIGHKISRGIRRAVKKTQPNAYLMGENFFDASAQLQGEEWDGVMNYTGFTTPLWHWLNGYSRGAHGFLGHIVSPVAWPTTAVASAWRSRRAAIPWVIALQQYNMLGSHDVPRIRTIVGGNDALHKLATLILMTFPGVPGLYYGDEIGMEDTAALGARGCMIWDTAGWNHDLLSFHKSLIALRKKSAALQRGGFQLLAAEEDSLIYQRETVDGRILVVAHRGEEDRPARPLSIVHADIPDGTRFREFFSGQEMVAADGEMPLPAHPQGATLWLAGSELRVDN